MLMIEATTLANRDFIMISSITLSTTLRPFINSFVSLYFLVCPSSIIFLSGAHDLLVTLLSTARFSVKTSWEFDGLMLSINWTTGAELSTLIQKLSSHKKVDNLDSVALFKLMALVSRFSRRGSPGKQDTRQGSQWSMKLPSTSST
ncbi:uncharacterized protein RHIMIDRAFT_53957 [Rhizopus microsporus ATCC 52813]|uniref:Uncharacterized protein n=1 Tax=Rhizopus microsporus ATCC 52813 TaxID=1340429 RepID=A0A2G4T4C7_RHIZD|nr:uncharacterized protein RHIMIDRAFT_53957 [Rhizopus microsporus ATCC 52813]PHZ15867.1 hypothetical protein RHIMIDRAFT_53957 [Rhizopus microsporus ATCC 52813]